MDRAQPPHREKEREAPPSHNVSTPEPFDRGTLFAALVDSSDDPTAIVDGELRFVGFNDAYAAAFEQTYGRPIAMGLSCADALEHLPEEREKLVGLWRRAVNGEAFTIEREPNPSETQGPRCVYQLRFKPLRGTDGQILGAVLRSRDVMDKRRAEEELQRLNAELEQRVDDRTAELECDRELLRKIIDNIPVMITIYDPAVQAVQINRECERLLGWTQAELDAIDLMEAVYPEREYRDEVREYMRSLTPGWRDLEMTTRDGRKLQTTWANIRLSDQRQVGIGLDITQRKQVENDLRRLTGNLEHEVAERTRHLERQTARLRRLANELTNAGQRERRRLAKLMHDHLQQLLVAGKMRLNGTRPDQLPEELAEPIRGAVELLDEAIDAGRSLTTELRPPVLYEDGLGPALRWLAGQMSERHQLTTELRLGKDAEPEDDAIKALLFETARELLFNSVKHGGADSADIKLESLGDRGTRLTIRDDGHGFDPAILDDDPDHHSGFGLFSIRERLKALGGSMEIDSSNGRGAAVSVEAPPNYDRSFSGDGDDGNGNGQADGRDEAPETSPEPGAEPDAAPIRVLLADDHQIVREGIAVLLEDDERITVVGEAEDGRDALEQAQRLDPDVVLMDVNMPEMNGIEATRRLTDTMPEIGVVGLSVHGDGPTERSCLDAGAFDYLSKNGDPQRLIDAIIRCHREHGM